jgi:hypothetical protein
MPRLLGFCFRNPWAPSRSKLAAFLVDRDDEIKTLAFDLCFRDERRSQLAFMNIKGAAEYVLTLTS